MSRRDGMAGMTGADRAIGGERTSVVELRQYTLHPGRRDALIELFEREFVESQEAVGAQVLGIFRDLDDPDRFVWLRGFDGMAARAEALTAFYTGAVWQAHREAANATMLDSDNVLLLRPQSPLRRSFEQLRAPRGDGVYGLSLHYIGSVDPEAFAAFFTRSVLVALSQQGSTAVTFVTESSPNTFVRLPVREGEAVFGWLSRWADADEMREAWEALDQISGWREDADPALLPALARKPERLRLSPTRRSRLR